MKSAFFQLVVVYLFYLTRHLNILIYVFLVASSHFPHIKLAFVWKEKNKLSPKTMLTKPRHAVWHWLQNEKWMNSNLTSTMLWHIRPLTHTPHTFRYCYATHTSTGCHTLYKIRNTMTTANEWRTNIKWCGGRGRSRISHSRKVMNRKHYIITIIIMTIMINELNEK